MIDARDPIVHYRATYVFTLIYARTTNSNRVCQLLHFVVLDVSFDIRGTAVLAVGFVLYSEPEQIGGEIIYTGTFSMITGKLY